MVTSQSYVPPENQQPQFPVAVQTNVQTPSAPLSDNSTPYNPQFTQQPNQLPYPPSPHQSRPGNLPYPANSNNPSFSMAADNRNNELPPSYDQVKDNKF